MNRGPLSCYTEASRWEPHQLTAKFMAEPPRFAPRMTDCDLLIEQTGRLACVPKQHSLTSGLHVNLNYLWSLIDVGCWSEKRGLQYRHSEPTTVNKSPVPCFTLGTIWAVWCRIDSTKMTSGSWLEAACYMRAVRGSDPSAEVSWGRVCLMAPCIEGLSISRGAQNVVYVWKPAACPQKPGLRVHNII